MTLTVVENYISFLGNNLGTSLLFTSKGSQKELLGTINNNTANEIKSYVVDRLSPLATYMKNTSDYLLFCAENELYVTYVFINEIIINYLAKKWEDSYNNYFDDISTLNLDNAIVRFCSIDTIDHSDNANFGNFIYYLMKNRKFPNNDLNFISCYKIFTEKLSIALKNIQDINFINSLKKPNALAEQRYKIDDVDLMTGLEFESFIAKLFSKLGYKTEVTKASGDQGIDVIVEKDGLRIGVQAKRYSNTVSNSAIQEVVAGINHYQLNKGLVITNNFFTNSARELAVTNSVILWDRNMLQEKIHDIF